VPGKPPPIWNEWSEEWYQKHPNPSKKTKKQIKAFIRKLEQFWLTNFLTEISVWEELYKEGYVAIGCGISLRCMRKNFCANA
jgi:hypothetical protein